MKTGILWDLDGTLLDTLADLTDAVNHTLVSYGLPCRTQQEVRSFVGNGARQIIAKAMPGRPEDPQLEAVLRDYQSYYTAHSLIKTEPYAGILPALEALAGKYPMAVVSNKPDDAVKLLCSRFFPQTYALGESPDCPRKPAPDMLYKAMQALGVDRCVYVGDSDVDILTADNIKMPCLSVTWGFRDKEQLEKAGARYLCEEPRQLPKKLEQLIAREFAE